jgi:hypothetical protein
VNCKINLAEQIHGVGCTIVNYIIGLLHTVAKR